MPCSHTPSSNTTPMCRIFSPRRTRVRQLNVITLAVDNKNNITTIISSIPRVISTVKLNGRRAPIRMFLVDFYLVSVSCLGRNKNHGNRVVRGFMFQNLTYFLPDAVVRCYVVKSVRLKLRFVEFTKS